MTDVPRGSRVVSGSRTSPCLASARQLASTGEFGYQHPSPSSHSGLSLLEVILALAILAGAITLLGELVGLGTRSAASARDLTRAQLLCESKLAEYTSGLVLPVSVQGAELEADPEWQYSVDVQPLGTTGLLSVTVAVQQNIEAVRRPAIFMLTRWMPDPNVDWPTEFPEATTDEEAAL